MPLSKIVNNLVHTAVDNEFIVIGALNVETCCFCCFCRHLCSGSSLDVLQKLELIRDELLDIYSTRSKKNMRHCQTSFEIVLFWPQQTCSIKINMNAIDKHVH